GDEGGAPHGIGSARLPRMTRRPARLPQRREDEDRSHRRNPRLVLVLRAEITEDLVRKMALEQLRGPVLPGRHEGYELLDLIGLRCAAEQVARARWRAGPLVQHRDRRLPSREALVEDGQV